LQIFFLNRVQNSLQIVPVPESVQFSQFIIIITTKLIYCKLRETTLQLKT
jgi:hypothetical protein